MSFTRLIPLCLYDVIYNRPQGLKSKKTQYLEIYIQQKLVGKYDSSSVWSDALKLHATDSDRENKFKVNDTKEPLYESC